MLVASFLGLKKPIHEESDLVELIRNGLPAKTLHCLARKTKTTVTQLRVAVHVDASTLARRIRSNTPLKSDESDRVVRVARIAALAVEAMGADDGIAWLNEPNWALGDRVPTTMLDTEIGARQVEDVLTRIQHGVYS
ncbi:MAG: type II RES/Xre toxin-antitoxin system antitoxin [Vulcanimicrobiaceae bacterium]